MKGRMPDSALLYLELRSVRFQLTTGMLSVFPDSVLKSMFPTGIILPKSVEGQNEHAVDSVVFGDSPSMSEDWDIEGLFPSIPSSSFISCDFDPRLFRFLLVFIYANSFMHFSFVCIDVF